MAEPPLEPDERQALQRARRLLRRELKDGPRPGRAVEIAAAKQGLARVLIAAADELGLRTRRGQWWLPGAAP